MKKVSEKEYKNYIFPAGNNTANRVYPLSIAEGFQSGDIYVNDAGNIDTVFFWHFCGFGYISGKAPEAFLDDIYSEMISGNNARRLVLITNDDAVITFFRKKDVLLSSRKEYSYLPDGRKSAVLPTDRFRIEQIDAENISKIEGRIIPSFSWETPDRFLKEGFGYIALDHERVCAAAFSAAVSSDEIDIGVETHEDCRRNGLASVLADKMCERIIRIGKKPVWAHSATNPASMNNALKCGFAVDRINTVISAKAGRNK